MRNVIGIDASTRSTGIAYYKDGVLESYELIQSSDKDAHRRIRDIYAGVKKYILEREVDHIFIENVPLANSFHKLTSEHLLVLQGTIYSVAIENGIGFKPFAPAQWRKLAKVKPEGRKREHQKKAAVEMVEETYHFGMIWTCLKDDDKNNFSDACEAILIGKAGLAYLDNIIEKGNENEIF